MAFFGGMGVTGRMGSPPKEERPSFTMKCFSIHTLGLFFFYILFLEVYFGRWKSLGSILV